MEALKGPDLAEVYDRYGAELHAYACVLCRSRVEAEDAVQECFVRLVAHRERLAHVEDLRGWCFRVLRNEALRLRSRWLAWRSRDRDAGTVLLQESCGEAETEAERREEARAIQRALASLPEAQREVVYLRVWESMSFRAVGDLVGIPQDTAASRYRYGIQKLRGLLGGREP
ncbi:MAG: RNA polymerase sigma factor [Planctomycetes bacterium]|nr:RNA polymerase sigma factor [Planctomycetota bacterium]